MKVVPAFFRAGHFADFSVGFEEFVKAADPTASEVSFEFGEGLYDWVQVGRVRWQENQPVPGLAQSRSGLEDRQTRVGASRDPPEQEESQTKPRGNP